MARTTNNGLDQVGEDLWLTPAEIGHLEGRLAESRATEPGMPWAEVKADLERELSG